MDNGGHFFEGAEKVLEICFSSSIGGADRKCDLRSIPRSDWDNVVAVVKAEIISFAQSDTVDSYVLSESSMFVSEKKFIVKTCGRTALLLALPLVLKLAKDHCDLDIVEDLFYSRKNFLKPYDQPYPHHEFDDEVTYLDTIVGGGSVYSYGDEGNDKWYFYNVSCRNNNGPAAAGPSAEDRTLEIMMSGLDKEVMNIFTKKVCTNGAEATEVSGIGKLFPSAIISDHLFDPCGYSMNGLLPGGRYFTIHITPEPDFSYVSFETNASGDYSKLVGQVVDIFKPSTFTIVLFNQMQQQCEGHHQTKSFDRGLTGDRMYSCQERRESETASGTVCYGFYKSAYS